MVDTLAPEMPVRRVRFDLAHDRPLAWHPEFPEFAAGADAISLLMPYAEPFVMRGVRDALRSADTDLRSSARAAAWMEQEGAHAAAHRTFNASFTDHSSTARRLDRLGRAIFARLDRTSVAFRIEFAAAFELVAFGSARWADGKASTVLRGADEHTATLFLWHLAEEVEHKGVVHDVAVVANPGRRRRVAALIAAFVVLIGFTVLGGLALFGTTKAALNPIRWARLIGWGFSLAFVLIPALAGSLAQDFHPEQLVDPPWMAMWLREFDPITATLPLWTDAGRPDARRTFTRSSSQLHQTDHQDGSGRHTLPVVPRTIGDDR